MPSIRQQISINKPPTAVWRALTTAEGLTSWWVDEARIVGQVGGRVVIVSEDDEGNPLEEAGVLLEFMPTRKFEIAWDSTGRGPFKGSRMQFQVLRAGGETRVVVVHSGGEALEDAEQNEALTKNWRASLRALRESLEGAS